MFMYIGDVTTNDHTNTHLKSNPALEAMHRAVETTESSHQVSTNMDKNHKQVKPNEGQLDHNSLTASDYITTPPNKSV